MEATCTALILAYPKPRERYVVYTDASNVEIRGVVSREQEG
jgi:hypothetical protein